MCSFVRHDVTMITSDGSHNAYNSLDVLYFNHASHNIYSGNKRKSQ